MGGIRVERASGSNEPLRAAAAAIEAGELVAIDAAGDDPTRQAFFDPVLKGRWGAARLQQLTRAPVIPIGVWGTEKVWPRSSRLPNVVNITDPPTVRDPRRATDQRAQGQVAERRHGADHEGDRRAAAAGGTAQADADSRGARGHLSARLQGRPGRQGTARHAPDAPDRRTVRVTV